MRLSKVCRDGAVGLVLFLVFLVVGVGLANRRYAPGERLGFSLSTRLVDAPYDPRLLDVEDLILRQSRVEPSSPKTCLSDCVRTWESYLTYRLTRELGTHPGWDLETVSERDTPLEKNAPVVYFRRAKQKGEQNVSDAMPVRAALVEEYRKAFFDYFEKRREFFRGLKDAAANEVSTSPLEAGWGKQLVELDKAKPGLQRVSVSWTKIWLNPVCYALALVACLFLMRSAWSRWKSEIA